MQEDEIESSRAPLIGHLIELRRRLMIGLAVWLVGTAVSYLFAAEIYGFLAQPLAQAIGGEGQTRRLIYTSLPETFLTYIHLSLFAGFFLAFPVIAAQLYGFLAPGLYKQERRALLPYLVISPLLFFAGAALAYYQVFPLAWRFFAGFEHPAGEMHLAVELEAKVSDYLALVMQVLIAFGLAFQLPVILTLLARCGFLTSADLAKARKYALIAAFLLGAVLTPPDVLSQLLLAGPLYLLYELSILSCKLIERGKERRHA